MRKILLTTAAIAAVAAPAQAKLTRIDVESRAPIDGGYELISGRFHGELDPNDPKNAIITDLKLAPRNARGMVEYSATFQIAKPVEMARASGFLFYSVPNRGNGRAGGSREGHINVVSGWQGDIPPGPNRQTATVPIARNPDGSPVTGATTVRFYDMPTGAQSVAITAGLSGGVPQPHPASLDTATARLIKRRSDAEAGSPVPTSDFAFANCTAAAPFPGTPDPTRLCLKGGFDPAYAYELTYVAKDPKVLGIGFAATRDLNTFLRYSADPSNPVAGQVKWTIATGVSQSGNYLRSFLNLGFNQGEDGKAVFDGMHPQIAGRQLPLNLRFAVPGGAAQLYEPGSEGVLWWSAWEDRERGLPAAGLLDRCTATRTCPKIMESFGAAEFWGLRMSPDLVGPRAETDIPLPPNVRRYYFPGVTHGGGGGGFAVIARNAQGSGACTLPANPSPTGDYLRALNAALADWVAKGVEPPPSQYPRLVREELVPPTARAIGWPAIPGAPTPDGKFNHFVAYDFGPGYDRKDVSGVMSRTPPTVGKTYASVVPRVNGDGNETSGLRTVHNQVPLGTYVGWNVQSRGYYAGQQCGFTGGYIPFAVTRAERMASGDPRPSLEERYGDHAGFVARVKLSADALVAGRYLLREDADRMIGQAEASAVLR